MKTSFLAVTLSFALLGMALPAQKTGQPPANPTGVRKAQSHPDEPEKAFQANCNRCHYAPEQLSPRITGTVIRHMRVRANLSAKDEQLILRFLNP